jgi:hypothetical protein
MLEGAAIGWSRICARVVCLSDIHQLNKLWWTVFDFKIFLQLPAGQVNLDIWLSVTFGQLPYNVLWQMLSTGQPLYWHNLPVQKSTVIVPAIEPGKSNTEHFCDPYLPPTRTVQNVQEITTHVTSFPRPEWWYITTFVLLHSSWMLPITR